MTPCNVCGNPQSTETGICRRCAAANLLRLFDEDDKAPSSNQGLDEEIRISGYTVLERIGRGGMGIVFKARQHNPNRIVALKVLLDKRFSTKTAGERFKREVDLAARLNHPGIVTIYESGFSREENLHFYTMELVENGVPLSQYACNREVHEQLRLIGEVLEAVQYAHSQEVIHRDLKPDNILVDLTGKPRILDFGMAKFIGDQSELTALSLEGNLLGTPAYMSPEQAAGKLKIGPASDVYSLGVIVYEILTGRLLYPTNPTGPIELHDLLNQILYKPHPPLPKSIPADLRAVVDKALAKNPSRRYQTAEAFTNDIHNFLAGRPVTARPLSNLGRGWLWLHAHPLLATVWGLIVSLLLVFSIGGTWTAHRQGVLLDQIADREEARREEWIRQLQELPLDWLPPLVEALRESGPEVERMVESQLAQKDLTEDKEIRLRALLCRQEDVGFLNSILLETDDLGMTVFLTQSLSEHGPSLVPDWWKRAYSDKFDFTERFRTLVPLVTYDPNSKHWRSMKGLMIVMLQTIPESEVPKVLYIFGPKIIDKHIRPELQKRFKQELSQRRGRDGNPRISSLLTLMASKDSTDNVDTLMKSDENFLSQIENLKINRETSIAILRTFQNRVRNNKTSDQEILRSYRARLLLASMQLDPFSRQWGQLRYPMSMRPDLLKRKHLLDIDSESLFESYKQTDPKKAASRGVRQGIAEILAQKPIGAVPKPIVDKILSDQHQILKNQNPDMDPRAIETAHWLINEWGRSQQKKPNTQDRP
ncbi:MAG: serine/threonine-protein kinase [Verrucomicrobiota bacterium]